ncbi:MOSC domain-containing protein [Fredinandcohnia sp. 179-A 10B2 NHS]|uniref:MOSC domain-containing protein n=1 Tax=Fredinandcohnia sp. 179-A 10B2 NHS TaxID=3235176 RepID=UPI0039A29F17
MKQVGKIKEITRYPVKSFAGEYLESCKIDTYGIVGDRFYSFYDETKNDWNRFVTARTIPAMLSYKANFIDNDVRITSPDGRTFSWNEELLQEIQRYSSKVITMSEHKSPHPDNPNLLSVDAASILLITDSTLHKLETMWGKKLDSRRFRANLLVCLDDSAMSESDWIGKRIFVGTTELMVDCFCERCSMTTIDPDTLERDASLLKKINKEMDLHFGVYASVIKTGEITVQDKVYIE